VKDYRCALKGAELSRYCIDESIDTIGIVYKDIRELDSTMPMLNNIDVSMRGWCYIDPRSIDYDAISMASNAGALNGFYLDPIADEYSIDKDVVGRVFDIAAANDLPIMLNLDNRNASTLLNTQPYLVQAIAVVANTVPMIICHGGVVCSTNDSRDYWTGQYLIESMGLKMQCLSPDSVFMHYCEMARDINNIYVDIGTMTNPFKIKILAVYLDPNNNEQEDIDGLLGKLVISSADPYGHFPISHQVDAMRRFGLRDDHIDIITSNIVPERVQWN